MRPSAKEKRIIDKAVILWYAVIGGASRPSGAVPKTQAASPYRFVLDSLSEASVGRALFGVTSRRFRRREGSFYDDCRDSHVDGILCQFADLDRHHSTCNIRYHISDAGIAKR